MSEGESKEDLAEARQEGRDQAGAGAEGAPSHGLFDSAEKEDAREQGFNEQRVADEAGKSNDDDD
jgi:hypothetical protein